ncbi:hypothetical protein KC19_1G274300 [Ceratodon purpureus]|uniref:Uncharacterized protein n=1 Tax=Ceratodon purpureus TaxID=3225 RepID=A0A8T0JCE0_CERPU|nr:hypothetical protein KC19_1G274300 [Ceratodon purpureus]
MALIGKILNAILYGFDYVSNIVVRRVSMAVIGKILSAFLYVFDYVSNIVVLWQYWNMFKTGHFYQNIEMDNQYFRTTSKVPFYVCLGLMICDPVVAAVAFMLKLRPGERPLLSVLLLPVIQLWKACRSEGGDDTRPEAEALFAITVAMENGPQLVLQLSVIYFLVWNSYDDISASGPEGFSRCLFSFGVLQRRPCYHVPYDGEMAREMGICTKLLGNRWRHLHYWRSPTSVRCRDNYNRSLWRLLFRPYLHSYHDSLFCCGNRCSLLCQRSNGSFT